MVSSFATQVVGILLSGSVRGGACARRSLKQGGGGNMCCRRYHCGRSVGNNAVLDDRPAGLFEPEMLFVHQTRFSLPRKEHHPLAL